MNNMNIGSVKTFRNNLQTRGPVKIFIKKFGINIYNLIIQYRGEPWFRYTASSLPEHVWVSPIAWQGVTRNNVSVVITNGFPEPGTPRRNK